MRKSLLLVLGCLLPVFVGAVCPEAGAGVTPYFKYCNVVSTHTSGGESTLIRAEVYNPNGQVPSSIKKITVEGPGGYLQILKPTDYTADNAFVKTVAGAPVEGEYKFTVLDTVGDTATSYYRIEKVTILPIVDSATFVASGNLTTPTLSWSDVSGYEGNLLFRVTVFDASSGSRVWISDLTGLTSVTVPSGKLAEGASYQWNVTAVDNVQMPITDNQSVSEAMPLAIGNEKIGFLYARVYSLKKADSQIYTVLDTRVAVPGGVPPDVITSFVVTGPNGFTYTFSAKDYNSGPRGYYHEIAATPENGMYTFTMNSTRGTAVTYHYFNYVDLPLVDAAGLQASGDALAPRLTWPAPERSDRSLFYSVMGRNTSTGSTVFSSTMSNPTYVVPTNTSLSDVSWRVEVRDLRWPYQPNNIARTNEIPLVVDNSRPNFLMGAGVYALNESGGTSTILDVYVNDPETGVGMTSDMSLVVTGPGGFTYTVQETDLQVAPLTSPNDYEYYHQVDPVDGALLGDGTYIFTLNYGGGKSLVTHEMLKKGETFPIVDENTFQVSGDPLAPTVSWSGIAGYPTHLSYRIKVYNSAGTTIYNSSREPKTAQTVPTGYLQSGESYMYRVEAQDDLYWPLYNTRSNSGKYPLEISQDTVPGAPTGVAATAGNGSAKVSFSAPGSNGGSAITSYTVIAQPGKIKASGKSSPITVRGLTNGVAYTFTVTAINAIGKSAQSDPSAAVTPDVIPGAPTNVTAIAGNAMAKVRFTPPVPNGGTPITSYTVTSYPGGITATGTKGSIKVTGLTNGTAYKFKVTATNAAGTGPASVKSNKVVPATVPDAPTDVIATPGDASAKVYFTVPASDGGSPITSYVVTGNRKGVSASGTKSPVKVKGLKNGKTYTFKVKAVNAVGAGPDSAESAQIVAGKKTGAAAGFVQLPGESDSAAIVSSTDDDI
ncbi:MAG: fibronectin type III domain-containing protein [Syntrophobacter sp.]